MSHVKRRNRHACHPIMQKGGVHVKSNKAKRRNEKAQLRRTIAAVDVIFLSFRRVLPTAL